jgi:hypothetical protein
MATATTKNQTDATTERIRDLNERILEAGKKAGSAYLDAYERTLQPIADYQESLAKQTDVEWISTVVDAQARFTRDLTQPYVPTGPRAAQVGTPRARAPGRPCSRSGEDDAPFTFRGHG